jgi:hypothetical protein
MTSVVRGLPNVKIAAKPNFHPERRLKSPCKLNKFLCAAALLTVVLPASAVPSTFGTVIGDALLCTSKLDTTYLYNYLALTFGQPYKHEGGAYWFKTPVTLWGAPMTDVLISDKDSPQLFIAAVAEATPEALVSDIANVANMRFTPTSLSATPVRISQTASTIVYFQRKSKIFCARGIY